jgi:ABC-type antimicrobial peptide transport system permease subunit
VCGAVALWFAPALILSRYPPVQMLDALAHAAMKPTGGELLTLALALAYVVLTGLLLGKVAGIPRRKESRALLRLAVASMVTLSLVATFIASVPLFFGALVMCFPSLI